ncbi:MAG TPA: hypothetical protein VGI43_12785 [Mucilaginibacter sp.]|jgi:hypothetical protein
MKKLYFRIIPAFLVLCMLQSCATVFGGRVNTYQRTKPLPGQQQRPLRVVAFIADIVLFWPGAIVDFATCAIYRPMPSSTTAGPAAPAAPTQTADKK